MSSFGSNQSESSSCFLARKRGKMAAWSMTSLITALPESPNSTHSSTYSDNATEFSTPRNQVPIILYKEQIIFLFIHYSYTLFSILLHSCMHDMFS